MHEILNHVARHAVQYLEELEERYAFPPSEAVETLARLDHPLPEHPTSPKATVELLAEVGSPNTVATAGGRYFGFVTGGVLPAALGASWLASAWDQNAGLTADTPIGEIVERIAHGWLIDLLRLPPGTAIGFVTGATMANFTAVTAARHAILARQGWDVEADGLFGAPPINVVVGEEVHVSLLKALAMSGLGRDRVTRVPADNQGRMRADRVPPLDANTLIAVQAGNVNTGAFDPVADVCARAEAAGAWVHVDGAFGLWAAAAPERAHWVEGVDRADSWATDGHKWLNVPYDSGMVFVREPRHLLSAMRTSAPYLPEGALREPSHYTPELSRRARGIEVWAALRSLGRSGVADLVERCCRYAARFAEGLSEAGFDILNDVVLNQVLVSFGDDEATRSAIARIQSDGTCWCGGTVWQDRLAMRISVSSWRTTAEDVEKSLDAMIRLGRGNP